MQLYQKMGYTVVSVDEDAKEVVKGPLSYHFASTRRLRLSMPLPLQKEEVAELREEGVGKEDEVGRKKEEEGGTLS